VQKYAWEDLYEMLSSQNSLQSEVKMKGTRRRLRLLMVVVLCFMGWAAFTLWTQSEKVDAKNTKLENLEIKLTETKSENEKYQHEMIRLNDPEYLEQLIRRDLNMTKPDETLFIQSK